MTSKATTTFYIAITFLILLPGCFDGAIEPIDPEGPVVSDNTQVITDQDWTTHVIEIDSADYSLNFNREILETYDLSEGDVIVSTVGHGLLRRIDVLTIEGNEVRISTSQAALSDIIEQGEVSIKRRLTISDVDKVKYYKPGIELQKSIDQQGDLFTWDINTVLYDHDGDLSTTNDQVRLEGEFTFYSDIIFEVEVRFPARLRRVQYGFETGNNANVSLVGEIEFKFEESIPIARVNFHPIIVYVGAPIVIVPTFEVRVGVSGGAEGKIMTSIEQEFSYEAGIVYERNSGWSPYSDRTTHYDFQPPQASLEATARAFVQPELELMMYGVLGAYSNGSLYGEVIIEPFSSPWWSVYTGFDLTCGARAQIIGYELFDVDYTLFEWRHQLGEAPTDISGPGVTTHEITNIDYTSATGGGEVTEDGGAPVLARGVVWSTSQNPTIDDNKTEDGDGTGSFTSELTGLKPGTQYYVRAYATNSSETAYGNELSFTTLSDEEPPTVSTNEITDITETSAKGGGNVTDDGNAAVTTRGVVWSTSQNPTIQANDGYTTDGEGTGSFTSNLTGLSSGTHYYVRAYATNSAGTAYGNQVSFTTDEATELATVITADITEITETSAKGGGEVTDDGGSTVTSRGVVWSRNPQPTLESNDDYTVDGAGIGLFESELTGLQPETQYFVRAYAANENGTAYGNEIEFTTDEGIDDVPPEVNEFLSPEDIETLKEKGLTIYKGMNPPNIEGNYYMDSLEDMETGDQFMDYSYQFSDQTPDLRVKISHVSEDGTDVAEGEGAFISGSDNTFSVYIEMVSEIDEGTHTVIFQTAQIYSGIISVDGIENFQTGFIVTHKENDFNEHFMEVGDARVIYEADGLAERVDSYPYTPAVAKEAIAELLKKMLAK